MDFNVSNNREAPSLNRTLTAEFAFMEAVWAVSRISDKLQAALDFGSNGVGDVTLFKLH